MSVQARTTTGGEVQLATFYLKDQLFGIDICEIQEINRQREFTMVAHTPDYVRGVINLRGEVVSILDLRTILGLGETEFGCQTRNIILRSNGEPVGLVVDRLSDVTTVPINEIEPALANIPGVSARFMFGVYQLAAELIVILKVEELFTPAESSAARS